MEIKSLERWNPLFVAQMMTGGVVSTSVTVWLQVARLPQQSTAAQVRVTVCGQMPLVTVLTTLIVTLVPQQAS